MNPVLDIRNLHFSYPDGLKALNNISFSVAEGEKVALVGPNGAGKSTLLLHFNGLLQGEGEVHICGTPVSEKSISFVRSMVGVVFQDPDDQLFSPTVLEDVAFGPLYMGLSDEIIHARVHSALDSVGMGSMVHRVPHLMSLGEKKLVAIATVLAMEPRLLVLDEPTSALDARSRRRILEVIRELPVTVVTATHDLGLVSEVMSRTIVIEGGSVVADGVPGQVLADVDFLVEHGLK